MTQGQITPDSRFGELLTKYAMEADTIVELGTWLGMGSTLCLANGLVRDTQRMWTVEQDEGLWKRAKANYDDPRITFLRGRIVGDAGFEEFSHPDPDMIVSYRWEKSVFLAAPNVADQLPEKAGLCLFDAGEWSSSAEMDLLLPRCDIICLDDTNPKKAHKNVRNRLELLRLGWEAIYDDLEARNGAAIFRRPNENPPNQVAELVKRDGR